MKNNFLYVFFAVAALLCCFVFTASAGYDIDTDNILELDKVDSLYECLAKGDVNDSGDIEASDARIILRVSVNLDKIDTSALLKADIDEDGRITAQDARLALRMSVGLEELPEHNIETFTVIPATCNSEGLTVKICTTCVKIYAQITEPASDDYHIFGNWETTEPNTCVKEGLAQIVCIHCGETVKELKLPATGIHKLTEWTYPEGKNCERDMPKVRTCENCDYSEKGIEPAGHDYRYVEIQKKTCVQDGIEVYKCTDCGTEGVDSNGKTRYVYKAPGYHNYENTATVLKEATCTEEGTAAYLCIYCDEPRAEISIPATGHTYGKYKQITKEPTCTETGTANAACEICGDSQEIVLDMIEHDVVENGWTVTIPPNCTENGAKEGYCRYCRDNVTVEIPANGHNITSWEHVTPATCSETGLKRGICSVCGDTDVTEEIEKLAHTFDKAIKYWYDGIPCKGPWNYYKKCDVCGEKEYYLTYNTEACTSIKDGVRQTKVVTEATCTEAETVIEYCIYCKEELGKESTNGSPLGHDYSSDWVITKTATCTENGTKTTACARNCGSISEETIPATGHTQGEFVTVSDPTCSTEGSRVADCTVCGETAKTEPIEKLPHTPQRVIIADSGEMDNEGYYTVKCKEICSECEEVINEVTTIQTFHVMSDFTVTFTAFEGLNAGDKISFTVDNNNVEILVSITSGKSNEITFTEDNGEYSFLIPEGLEADDEIFITVFSFNN